MQTELVLALPGWMEPTLRPAGGVFATQRSRMEFVLGLARQNIEHRTGGPFGAAVFEGDAGTLISVGVNLVTSSHCSMAHAEMVAVSFAQQALHHFDLGKNGGLYELVTSTEPCAMCLGAIPWSGVRRVVCGARGKDACAIGFDEGAKPRNWVASLRNRGIEVVRDVLRSEARAVLREYATSGGLIYNPEGR